MAANYTLGAEWAGLVTESIPENMQLHAGRPGRAGAGLVLVLLGASAKPRARDRVRLGRQRLIHYESDKKRYSTR